MKIPIAKTLFDPDDVEAVTQPLKDGWVSQGRFVRQFEERFCAFTGAKNAIAVSSCSTALHLALAALDVRPGDEVIVPAFTWIATANAIEHLGATPVFCDIDLSTYNIDITQIESKISRHTKAILPVHLFGLPSDMHAIQERARNYHLKIVEDAACGFGAFYHHAHVGRLGDVGCFSFHPRKAITTGEGGMITTADHTLAEKMRALRNHGATPSDGAPYDSEATYLPWEYNYLGFNYRMTDIQGALGVAQMKKAKRLQEARQARAETYHQILADCTFLRLPSCPAHMTHGWQSYVCLFAPEEPHSGNLQKLNTQRNQLMARLEDLGVSTRQGTHAVTIQGYYRDKYKIPDQEFPGALIADKLTLALPLYPQMTSAEQMYVGQQLNRAFAGLHD